MKNLSSRWLVVVGAVCMQLCIGGIYTWSLFNQPLAQANGWAENDVYLAYSMLIAFFAFVTIFSGKLQDKIGPRIVALIGIAFFGLGLILTSRATSLWQLYLFYSFIAGTGVGFVYVCPLATCLKWFPDKKGFITGISVGAFGAGGFLFNSILENMIQSVGVSRTFFYQGLIYLVIGVIGALLLREPTKNSSDAPRKFVNENQFTSLEMVKTKSFYLIWFIYLTGTVTGLIVLGLSRGIAVDLAGLTPAIATSAVAVTSIFNAIGRMVWGFLSDKFGRMKIITILFGVTILSVGLLSFISFNQWGLFFVLANVAHSFGGFLAIFPALTSDYYGTENSGANYGLVYQGYGIAGLIGPILLSIMGDMRQAFFVSMILAIIGMILTFFVSAPRVQKTVEN